MPMLSAGMFIGGYTVARHVATSAMSEIYEAVHPASGQQAAVKVLLRELCDDEERVTRFRNEAQLLQGLQHERVVRVFAHGLLSQGAPYMVLEWLPLALQQVLAQAGGALGPSAALEVARQLAEALAGLHERGIIHRDVKPANVLLARGGSAWDVKLADFGLAKLLSEAERPGAQAPGVGHISTGRATLLGTWEYMAPEQWIQSKGVDAKVDVYALGVVLFEMLAGRLPFVAEAQNDLMCFHLFHDPPLQQLEGLVTASTAALVARMLEKDPAHRPAMREVLLCTTPAQS